MKLFGDSSAKSDKSNFIIVEKVVDVYKGWWIRVSTTPIYDNDERDKR